MRLSNSLAVGSPTMRVSAVMAATLLLIVALAAAGIAGRNLLAADGTIVVDPQGNGDFTTINEAVAAAEDGDTELLKAGRYPESVLVDRAITIRGEEPGTGNVMSFQAGRTSIKGSDLGKAWLLTNSDSHVTIEDSDFEAIFANHTADSEPYVLRDNRIVGTIYFTGPMVIEGNEFLARAEGWKFDPYITADGTDWVVQDNTFVGARGPNGAVNVGHMAGPGTIEGNSFTDNEVGVFTASKDLLELAGNVMSDGDIGIQVNAGAPSLVGNTIEGMSEVGVTMIISEPTLTGNTLCDSAIDLFIGSGSEPIVDADNEICVTKTPEDVRNEDG